LIGDLIAPSAGERKKKKAVVSGRLLEIKRILEPGRVSPKLIPEVVEEEEEELELEEWRKIELERPFAERLVDSVFRPLLGPASKIARGITGLEMELYRANMRIAPTKFVALMLGNGIMFSASLFLLFSVLIDPLLGIMGGGLGFILGYFLTRIIPRIRINKMTLEINKNLPYALRHIATQLKSGIALTEALTSVAQSDYGALSDEMRRVIMDVHRGLSLEEALGRLWERTESEGLKRSIRQINRALRIGGDLSEVLYTLAEDISYEMRMKIRDYAQTLNTYGLIFMFLDAIGPTMALIMVLIMSTMAKQLTVSLNTLALVYLLLIPTLLFYFVYLIKRMEPTA